MSGVRSAAVAGMFYPGRADELRDTVRSLLAAEANAHAAEVGSPTFGPGSTDGQEGARADRPVKALIAPHAGYIYSGPTAAAAFRAFVPDAETIRRVVILGPAHRVAVRGLALPSVAAFETPLGEVPIDTELAARVANLPQVEISDRAHSLEHSLEVELPFLQLLLPEFRILPLVVGEAAPSEVAEVLDLVWGGDETRFVISSDLSHYQPYERAARLDRETAEDIVGLRGPIAYDRACGAGPINGLLAEARRRHLGAQLVDLRSSGDTAGDHDRVVGYGAFTFSAAA